MCAIVGVEHLRPGFDPPVIHNVHKIDWYTLYVLVCCKSMAKRLSKVNCTWTAELAYVVGIFTSDGNLSSDGRHLNITSKDKEMIETARSLLNLKNVIGTKSRGTGSERKYYTLQFGDINFYEFLISIGLHPAKSKTLTKVLVPRCYFVDFLRGCIDGDGCIDSFTHPESSKPQIRVRLASASPAFLKWVLGTVRSYIGIAGGFIVESKSSSVASLVLAKADSLKLLRCLYYSNTIPALQRKRLIAINLLDENSVATIR